MGNLAAAQCQYSSAFICFFYALKMIEPAIVGAVDISVGPLLAVLITLGFIGEKPAQLRIVVCIGTLAGCGLLAAAVEGSGFSQSDAAQG